MSETAEGPRPRRRRQQAAVVVAALAAILVISVLADERVLVADPDPSAVTAGDVQLARSLLRGAVPPEVLVDACITDGTIDPACLGDRGLRDELGELDAGVVPRACRDARSVPAECIEREMGVDVPDRCVDDGGGIDVSCLAGAGTLLVLTDACLDGRRLRQECLTPAGYGVPDDAAAESGFGGLSLTGRDRRDGAAGGPDDGASADPDRPAEGQERTLGDVVGTLANVVAGGVLAALAIGVVVVCLRALTGRRPDPAGPTGAGADDGGGDGDGPVLHDAAVMAASVDTCTRRLDLDGDHRGAIIAAYAALLDGLGACAQGRRPAETPLEHMQRVLGTLDVRPEPLLELTVLFEEARFSEHPMADEHRRRARSALTEAAADLDRVRDPVG